MPAPLDRSYEHRFHAGNVGDVWKHVALLTLLDAGPPNRGRTLVDTHAGAGSYALGPTGEWTEGVGRLLELRDADLPRGILRYLAALGAKGRRLDRYPGSPGLFLSRAAPGDRVVLIERVDETRSALEAQVGGDTRAVIQDGDGFTRLLEVLKTARDEVISLIDPPFAERTEWTLAARAVASAHQLSPAAQLILWYPIKSYARPNVLLAEVEKAGVPATAIELVTTPLTSKKNRLNGSGVLLVNARPGVVEELAALAVWLGPRLATQDGRWTTRCTGQKFSPSAISG